MFIAYAQSVPTAHIDFVVSLTGASDTPGEISLAASSSGPEGTVTLVSTVILTFPGPISMTSNGIQIVQSTGFYSGAIIESVDASSGVIRINLPAGLQVAPGSSGIVKVTGFLVPSCGSITFQRIGVPYGFTSDSRQGLGPFQGSIDLTSAHETNGTVQIYSPNLFKCGTPRVFIGQIEATGVTPLSNDLGLTALLPSTLGAGTYRVLVYRTSADRGTFYLSIASPGGLAGHEFISIPRTLPEKSEFSISGTCPANKKILSGGMTLASEQSVSTLNRIQILGNSPSSSDSWTITGVNQNPVQIPVFIHAVCVQ